MTSATSGVWAWELEAHVLSVTGTATIAARMNIFMVAFPFPSTGYFSAVGAKGARPRLNDIVPLGLGSARQNFRAGLVVNAKVNEKHPVTI